MRFQHMLQHSFNPNLHVIAMLRCFFTMQWKTFSNSTQYQQYCEYNAQFNLQTAACCYVCADCFVVDIIWCELQPKCVNCCQWVKHLPRNEIPFGGGTWVYASTRNLNTMGKKNGVTRGQVISILDWYSRPFIGIASIAGGAHSPSVFIFNIN